MINKKDLQNELEKQLKMYKQFKESGNKEKMIEVGLCARGLIFLISGCK